MIIDEDPLKLLIGCTPPNLYKLVAGKDPAKLIPSFQNLEGQRPMVYSMGRTSSST